MKFLIDRLAFRDALQKVEMAIGRKPTRPVLGGVLIEAQNDQVVLMATDLDISVRYSCLQVQVETPGWTVLPGRELVEVVKDTESETVTINQESTGACEITAGEDHCSLVCLESGAGGSGPEAFPVVPELDGAPTARIEKETFMLMVGSTRFATSKSQDNKYATEGVLLEFEGGQARMVSTDGRRLACIKRPADVGEGIERAVLLPKVLDQVQRYGQDEEGAEIEVYLLGNLVGFRVGGLESFGRVLDRDFPVYEKVIPQNGKHVVAAHRESFSRKLRLASHLTQDSAASVKLELKTDNMGITAETEGRGKAAAQFEVSYSGEDFEASFNPTFILEGLKAAHQENIEMQLENADQPARFVLGEDYDYVVMPLSKT
ncbi:MAG TPA: DNA polymerase III subunit beta [Planctomycetes bacterium]|nr:DNA polymerase III subunit beta [Planctomycetota bacterium]